MAKKSRRTPKSAATAAINGNPASGDPSAKPTALAGLDAADQTAEWRRFGRSNPPKRAGLVATWTEIHGGAPPKGISTRLLALAAEYNAQARQHGGLKASTRRALYSLATDRDEPETRTRRPPPASKATPGARLVREWHGQAHVVDVLDNAVLYRGRSYRSLSEVARIITGARWSGPRFFGL